MRWAGQFREWLEETHSTGFELRRHFFRRFFDSEMVLTAGQWQTVAIGALAIVASLSIIMTQAYFGKYRRLLELDSSQPYELAALADHLLFITVSMTLTGLLTVLQWPSLFPGLRDYLALAGLPIRTQDIFVAKFSALLIFAAIFIVGMNLFPSFMLPAVMAGRHLTGGFSNVIGLLLSTILSGFFIFFVLVALQGVLLNIVPATVFPRVSLFVQGLLLIALVCALPFVFSIANLYPYMNQRPEEALWTPPVWFLGLDQAVRGNREGYVLQLCARSLLALAAAAVAAVGMYLWSYRRHRVRVLEAPVEAGHHTGVPARLRSRIADWIIPDARERAVFAFVAATLSRSRQHRMVLTAFVALAVALIFESFVSIVTGRGFRGFAVQTFALRQAGVSAVLALSLFVLAGFRYLFRLPVELRANWVFQLNEAGNREIFLGAVQRFVFWFGVIPVSLLTLPLEVRIFGPWAGVGASLLALLPSLILMEVLLYQFQRIPFTSSYLPGKRPLIETVVLYGAAVGAYVTVLSGVIVLCLEELSYSLTGFGALLAVWARVRKGRLEEWEFGKLEFEELPEPAVHTLGIGRD